jgi:type VI secretion system protein ImpJ
MKQLCRVVWSEGMYLGPQEFQAQSAWFENSVAFGTDALWFKPYGYVACSINEEALANGTFSLLRASGIFPDGLPFAMDECDPLPPPRTLDDLFSPATNRLLMNLAVPAYRPAQRNTAAADGNSDQLRFTAVERKFVDENNGIDEKQISFGRKNIRVLAETELAEGMTLLPLARIRRDHEGKFVQDERFIPPCVRINASPGLVAVTERLIAVLADKAESVRTSGAAPVAFSAGISSHQVESFWFRHAIDSALPVLRHLCFSQRGHPQDLFTEMSRLAGALCTFSLHSNATELPLYDHHDLETCFHGLDAHIRDHLELLSPSNCVVIPLPKSSDYFYEGDIRDARCFGHSQWVLAVRAPLDEVSLIRRVPLAVKVCSTRYVGEIVRRAVPGLQLRHLSIPPAAITPRVDTQYYSLHLEGPCWESIIQTKQVGVYVPGEFPNPELELLVLVEGR